MKEDELLEQLSNAFYDSTVLMRKERIATGFIDKRVQAQKEIVALIKKSKVTKEFVKKWAKALKAEVLMEMEWENTLSINIFIAGIEEMLKDAGFSVA